MISTSFSEPYSHDDGFKRTSGDSFVVFYANVPFVTIKAVDFEAGGYDFGKLLTPELSKLEELVNFIIESKVASFPVGTRSAAKLLLSWRLNRAYKSLPDTFRSELNGIVEGSGISLRTLLFCTMGAEIMTPKASHSCSVFISPPNSKLESQGIHGHNLDYQPSVLGRFPCVIRFIIPNYPPHGLITFLGSLGALQGWVEETEDNQAMSLSLNVIRDFVERKGVLPMALFCRQALMTCKNIVEVHTALTSHSAVFGWMVAVSSPKEKSGFIMDFGHDQKAATWTLPEEPIRIAAVNRYLTKEARGATSSVGHNDHVMDDVIVRGLGTVESVHRLNELRWLRLCQIINQVKYSALTSRDVFLILSDCCPATDTSSIDIGLGNVTVCKENCLETVVFDLENEECILSAGPGYAPMFPKLVFNLNDAFGNVTVRKDIQGDFFGSQNTVFGVRPEEIDFFRKWHMEFTLLTAVGRSQEAINFTYKVIKQTSSSRDDWSDFDLDCDYHVLPAHLYSIHSAWVESKRKIDINCELFCQLCKLAHSRRPHIPYLRIYLADVLLHCKQYAEAEEVLSFVVDCVNKMENYGLSGHDDREHLYLIEQSGVEEIVSDAFICKDSNLTRAEAIDGIYLLVKIHTQQKQFESVKQFKALGSLLMTQLSSVFGIGNTDLLKLKMFD
ncbi:hypothetical protein P9112_004879 [Eukaryota sp. TZLM1-RC]